MSILSNVSEDFLHFVWRTLNFELNQLSTISGESIQIVDQGKWNHNQGPDFLHARLRIDGLEWYGHVELHLKSKDWYKHKHHLDPHYNGTILHVVLYADNKDIFREDGTNIPQLQLHDRISKDLLARVDQLLLAEATIPCTSQLHRVAPSTIQSWINYLAKERILQKAERIKKELSSSVQDWEQILWEELAQMMGGPVNGKAFRELAQRLPTRIWKKHVERTDQLEALFFGVSGHLQSHDSQEEYYKHLQNEWNFLRHKYQLPIQTPLRLLFLRMRPAGFPTIRISQMAVLLHRFPHLLMLLEAKGIADLLKSSIVTTPYWQTHYRFFESGKKRIKTLGKNQKELLIANVLLPTAWLYMDVHQQLDIDRVVMEGLGQLGPENNRITRLFTELGWKNNNSIDSQGMIQLKKKYCDEKRCISCSIGTEIIYPPSAHSS